MATTQNSYFENELQQRRQRLQAATQNGAAADASIYKLLESVDVALARLHQGAFGICETCHDAIEADRLLCNPLLRFCLDHLSEQEQRALEKDLLLAAGIQRGLLPRENWSAHGWNAHIHYQPANVVSGDYCDLIESENAFLFLLGDVSGKGVAASMLMSHLHATFRSLSGRGLGLSAMVEHANRLFCESTIAGQFATMVVGCAWPDGRVEYVSAGHLPVLHLSASGITAKESTGVPFGMFCTTNFPVCQLQLSRGDRLFLYTDGLTEIFNSAGDEFGLRRVQALAAKHVNDDPKLLINDCLHEMKGFSAVSKQSDDLTIMVMHRA